MWTHHFTFDVMEPETDSLPEAILASYNDEEVRTFCVQFFLEDTRLQRKETCLRVEDKATFTAHREGHGDVEGIFSANERGMLDKITLIVRDNNPQQAIWFCQRLVSYILSNWSLIVG